MATNSDKVSNTNYIPDDISFSSLSKLPLKSLKIYVCLQTMVSFIWKPLFHANVSHQFHIYASVIVQWHISLPKYKGDIAASTRWFWFVFALWWQIWE